ncbi:MULTISPECIES: hypothetical protein [Lysinibacillus]|nr:MULTISPECIES: hypothetical protein [Lysinibacillus]MDC6267381.1 hypothetical protein [Lysinibacillus sphaericus]MDN4968185.1 hypothetical protein [Lysinibacillus fusiformis]MDN4968359.1 hypothetical protein [Lysinibacillus fusiformis]
MSGIVVLLGQIGIALGGFIGMASVLNWYHGGGKQNDKSNSKLPLQ